MQKHLVQFSWAKRALIHTFFYKASYLLVSLNWVGSWTSWNGHISEFSFCQVTRNMAPALGVLFATFSGYASLLSWLRAHLQARNTPLLPALKSNYKNQKNDTFLACFSFFLIYTSDVLERRWGSCLHSKCSNSWILMKQKSLLSPHSFLRVQISFILIF